MIMMKFGVLNNLIYILPVFNLGGCNCCRTLTVGWVVFEFAIKVSK